MGSSPPLQPGLDGLEPPLFPVEPGDGLVQRRLERLDPLLDPFWRGDAQTESTPGRRSSAFGLTPALTGDPNGRARLLSLPDLAGLVNQKARRVRLSPGIEDAGDLIADLTQALARAGA